MASGFGWWQLDLDRLRPLGQLLDGLLELIG